MLNLNKNTRNIKGIALILALVMMLAICLVGCTDQEARDAAQEAKDKAAAAVTTAQLNDAITNALNNVETVTLEEVNSAIATALADYVKLADLPAALTREDVESIVAAATANFKSCTCTGVVSCTCEIKTAAEVEAIVNAAVTASATALRTELETLKGEVTSNNESLDAAIVELDEAINALNTMIETGLGKVYGQIGDLADSVDALEQAVAGDLTAALENLKEEVMLVEKWDNTTEDVIELMPKVDLLLAGEFEFDGVKYNFAADKNYYSAEDWEAMEAQLDGLKIRLLRAYDANAAFAVVVNNLDSFTTIKDDDFALESALNAIAATFPVSLDDESLIANVKAEYEALVEKFGQVAVDAYIGVTAGKDASFTANYALLGYAEAKIADLKVRVAAVDALVKAYIESLGVDFTNVNENEAGLVTVLGADVLVNVGTDDVTEIAAILANYVDTFLGEEMTIDNKPEDLTDTLQEGTSADILAADTFLNEADEFVANDEHNYFVYFCPALDVYAAECYAQMFASLKANTVVKMLGYIEDAAVANNATKGAKDDLTAIATKFTEVLTNYAAWKVAPTATYLELPHYLTMGETTNVQALLAVVDGALSWNNELAYYSSEELHDWAAMYETAKNHFGYIMLANQVANKFDGFQAIIDGYFTAGDKAAYVAEVTDELYIKAVIDAAYSAKEHNPEATTRFYDLRTELVIAIAGVSDEFLAVNAGAAQIDVLNKAVEAVENAYIQAVLAMEYDKYAADYKVGGVESVDLVNAHFGAIYDAYEAVLDTLAADADLTKAEYDVLAGEAAATVDACAKLQ